MFPEAMGRWLNLYDMEPTEVADDIADDTSDFGQRIQI